MSTIQMIAIGAAAVIVLLLILALLVTRRRATRPQEEPPAPSQASSASSESPQDAFAPLGEVVPPPAATAAEAASEASQDAGATQGRGDATGAQGPSQPMVAGDTTASGPADSAVSADGAESTLVIAPAASIGDASGGQPVPPDASEASPPGTQASQTVPLSDVIVTTSGKMVDLQDPEVRRMLTDLVRLEVDQAIEYRRHGQTVDAVMQLAEAERISCALGLTESADRVRRMAEELKRQS